MHTFQDIFTISALRQRGLDELRTTLLQQAKPAAWKLDSADYTDMWPEDVAEEVCLRMQLLAGLNGWQASASI